MWDLYIITNISLLLTRNTKMLLSTSYKYNYLSKLDYNGISVLIINMNWGRNDERNQRPKRTQQYAQYG